MTYLAFLLGLILLAVGIYRMRNDFASDKRKNNIWQLILTGQASGIGQVLSGLVMIAIGVVSLFIK